MSSVIHRVIRQECLVNGNVPNRSGASPHALGSTRRPLRSGEPRISPGLVTNHRARFDAWKRAAAATSRDNARNRYVLIIRRLRIHNVDQIVSAREFLNLRERSIDTSSSSSCCRLFTSFLQARLLAQR